MDSRRAIGPRTVTTGCGVVGHRWTCQRRRLRCRVWSSPRLGVDIVHGCSSMVGQGTHCTGYTGRCISVWCRHLVAGEAARRGLPALLRGAKQEPRNHVAAGFCRQKFRKMMTPPSGASITV